MMDAVLGVALILFVVVLAVALVTTLALAVLTAIKDFRENRR